MYRSIDILVVLILCLMAPHPEICKAQDVTGKSAESTESDGMQTSQRSTTKNEGSMDPYRKYAEALFRSYDRNRDGFLDKSDLMEMRRPPQNADSDGDEKISMDELVECFSSNWKRSHPIKVSGTGTGLPKKKEKINVRANKNKGKSVFEADFHLMQFDETEATRGEFDEFLSEIGQPEMTMDAILDIAHARADFVNSDELRCQLIKWEEVNVRSQSHKKATNLHLSIKLVDVEPQLRCRIEVEKDYLLVSGNESYAEPVGDQKAISVDPEKDKLEQLILAKIEERKRKMRREVREKSSEALGTLYIDTTLVCKVNGWECMSFTSEGSRWILAAEFEIDD